MWYAFFVFGSIWFWFLVLIEFIILTALVEHEESWWSFLSVVMFIALIHLFGNVNIFAWMKEHPYELLRWITLYAIIGTCWGIGKFYFYNASAKRAIDKYKPKFYKNFKNKEWQSEEEMDREWKRYLHSKLTDRQHQCLDLEGQASKVIFWISYWPVSSFWTILNDPLRRFGEWIYYTCFVRVFKYIHNTTVGEAVKLDKSNIKISNNDDKE